MLPSELKFRVPLLAIFAKNPKTSGAAVRNNSFAKAVLTPDFRAIAPATWKF
jgi:hypothetical protein